MALILFFIIILNVVAIALTYYCLQSIDKKEKIIFIGVGLAIIYLLTSFVYWLSTKEIAIKVVAETGKNLITFIFVPINIIIILPIIAKSYARYKMGGLASDKLRNRIIILAILLFVILMVEKSYFKDIQNGVIKLIENNTNMIQNENTTKQNEMINESKTNEMYSNIENVINSIE